MHCIESEKEVTLPLLLEELDSVVDWFHFGLILGIPDHELTMIKIDNPNVSLCKTQMLRMWMRMKKGSWSDIVRALVHIRMNTLAHKIAEKYGMFTSILLLYLLHTIFIYEGINMPPAKLGSAESDLPIEVCTIV